MAPAVSNPNTGNPFHSWGNLNIVIKLAVWMYETIQNLNKVVSILPDESTMVCRRLSTTIIWRASYVQSLEKEIGWN